MEDFYMNITSQNNSYDYSNITSNYSNITSNYSNITSNYSNITSDYSNMTYNYSNITSNYSNITSNYSNITDDYYDYYYYYDFYDWYYSSPWFIMDVVTCVIIGVGLLSTLMGINTLYSEVRNDHVAPIYVINLLISDIIQFCCMIIDVTPTDLMIYYISDDIYYCALVASVCFMVCIALERYLVVAHPLWYRFRRTIKISVVVCVLVWVLALVFVLTYYFSNDDDIIFSVFSLLPLPLFIFFLVGTLKALSASISVPSDEKRRIVAVLVVVLLIYTLLFLPNIILEMKWITRYEYNLTHYSVSFIFLRLSPLADLILYIFMRKGTMDKFLSSVCCCRMDSDDTNSSSV